MILDKIKVAQFSDPKLTKFRTKVLEGKRTYYSVSVDGEFTVGQYVGGPKCEGIKTRNS